MSLEQAVAPSRSSLELEGNPMEGETGGKKEAAFKSESPLATSSTEDSKEFDPSAVDSSGCSSPVVNRQSPRGEKSPQGAGELVQAVERQPTPNKGAEDLSSCDTSDLVSSKSPEQISTMAAPAPPAAGINQVSGKQPRRVQGTQPLGQPPPASQFTSSQPQQHANRVPKVSNKPVAVFGARATGFSPRKGRATDPMKQQPHGSLRRGRPGPAVTGDNTVPLAPGSSPESTGNAVCNVGEPFVVSPSEAEAEVPQMVLEGGVSKAAARRQVVKQASSTGASNKAKKSASPSGKSPSAIVSSETPTGIGRTAVESDNSGNARNFRSAGNVTGTQSPSGGRRRPASSLGVAAMTRGRVPGAPAQSRSAPSATRVLPTGGISAKMALRKEIAKLREALQAILAVVQGRDSPECVTVTKLCADSLEVDLSNGTADSTGGFGTMVTMVTSSPAAGTRHRSRLLRSKRFLGTTAYSPGKRGLRGRNVSAAPSVAVGEYSGPRGNRGSSGPTDSSIADSSTLTPYTTRCGIGPPIQPGLMDAANVEAAFHAKGGIPGSQEAVARMPSYSYTAPPAKYYLPNQVGAQGAKGYNHQYYYAPNTATGWMLFPSNNATESAMQQGRPAYDAASTPMGYGPMERHSMHNAVSSPINFAARHQDELLSIFPGVGSPGGPWQQAGHQAPLSSNSRIPQPQHQRLPYGGRSSTGASVPQYPLQQVFGGGPVGSARTIMQDVRAGSRLMDASNLDPRRGVVQSRPSPPFDNSGSGKVLLPFLASPAESNHPICVHIREELRTASTEEAVQKLIDQARSLKIQSLVDMGMKKLRKFQQQESNVGIAASVCDTKDTKDRQFTKLPVTKEDALVSSSPPVPV